MRCCWWGRGERCRCCISLEEASSPVVIQGYCFDAPVLAEYITTRFDLLHPVTRLPLSPSDLRSLRLVLGEEDFLSDLSSFPSSRSDLEAREHAVSALEAEVLSLSSDLSRDCLDLPPLLVQALIDLKQVDRESALLTVKRMPPFSRKRAMKVVR